MQVGQPLDELFGVLGDEAFLTPRHVSAVVYGVLEGTELLQDTGHGASNHVLHVDVQAAVLSRTLGAYVLLSDDVVVPQVGHDASQVRHVDIKGLATGMLQPRADLDLVLQRFLELHVFFVRGVDQHLENAILG